VRPSTSMEVSASRRRGVAVACHGLRSGERHLLHRDGRQKSDSTSMTFPRISAGPMSGRVSIDGPMRRRHVRTSPDRYRMLRRGRRALQPLQSPKDQSQHRLRRPERRHQASQRTDLARSSAAERGPIFLPSAPHLPFLNNASLPSPDAEQIMRGGRDRFQACENRGAGGN
jgi:hypothetical protein